VELKEMFKEYKNNSKNINGTQIKKKTWEDTETTK
jgi:hypothetical protein